MPCSHLCRASICSDSHSHLKMDFDFFVYSQSFAFDIISFCVDNLEKLSSSPSGNVFAKFFPNLVKVSRRHAEVMFWKYVFCKLTLVVCSHCPTNYTIKQWLSSVSVKVHLRNTFATSLPKSSVTVRFWRLGRLGQYEKCFLWRNLCTKRLL